MYATVHCSLSVFPLSIVHPFGVRFPRWKVASLLRPMPHFNRLGSFMNRQISPISRECKEKKWSSQNVCNAKLYTCLVWRRSPANLNLTRSNNLLYYIIEVDRGRIPKLKSAKMIKDDKSKDEGWRGEEKPAQGRIHFRFFERFKLSSSIPSLFQSYKNRHF